MSAVPFLDLAVLHAPIRTELDKAYQRVMDSGWFIAGPELEAFESEFALYCQAKHCVGVGNGLDAIHLLLRAYGIGTGDEVLVPALCLVEEQRRGLPMAGQGLALRHAMVCDQGGLLHDVRVHQLVQVLLVRLQGLLHQRQDVPDEQDGGQHERDEDGAALRGQLDHRVRRLNGDGVHLLLQARR